MFAEVLFPYMCWEALAENAVGNFIFSSKVPLDVLVGLSAVVVIVFVAFVIVVIGIWSWCSSCMFVWEVFIEGVGWRTLVVNVRWCILRLVGRLFIWVCFRSHRWCFRSHAVSEFVCVIPNTKFINHNFKKILTNRRHT